MQRTEDNARKNELIMDCLTSELLNMSVAELMDYTREKLLEEDSVYQQFVNDVGLLEKECIGQNFSETQQKLLEKYTASIRNQYGRYADISYEAGIKDTITLLKKLDLIKSEL